MSNMSNINKLTEADNYTIDKKKEEGFSFIKQIHDEEGNIRLSFTKDDETQNIFVSHPKKDFATLNIQVVKGGQITDDYNTFL